VRRLILATLLAALTLLALEGALSALGQPSLLRRLPRLWGETPYDSAWRPLSDEERRRAAAENPGIWSAHPDPRVGYVLRSDSVLVVLDGLIRSDGLGLRRRAAEPRAGALRIAVLGASIPFGYGLDDNQTLAHRLEHYLDLTRGPAARAVEARTVAISRWNMRNAVAFLLDHLPELSPDLVLVMPFENDLSDTDQVNESGHRRVFPDPAAADPWLSARMDATQLLLGNLTLARQRGLAVVRAEQVGPLALSADLGPESARRYDENVALLLHLRERLAARGARLACLVFVEDPYSSHLLRRLLAGAPDLPVIPLLRSYPGEFTLGHDPHPSAQTVDVLACWVAADLLRLGLVDAGAARPLPPAPAEYQAQRATPRGREEFEAHSRAARELALQDLEPAIDFTSGRGIQQVYGGCGALGTAGPRLLALLPRGPTLVVELAPLAERPDLHPLRVQVLADGAPLGELQLEPGQTARARFALPGGAPAIEIKLVASDWIVGRFSDSAPSETAAYRPLRLACEDG